MLLVVWCVFESNDLLFDVVFCGDVSIKIYIVWIVYNKVVDYVIKE